MRKTAEATLPRFFVFRRQSAREMSEAVLPTKNFAFQKRKFIQNRKNIFKNGLTNRKRGAKMIPKMEIGGALWIISNALSRSKTSAK
jgi:hypothetical protein